MEYLEKDYKLYGSLSNYELSYIQAVTKIRESIKINETLERTINLNKSRLQNKH